MEKLTIKSNYHERELLTYEELTEKEKDEFDYSMKEEDMYFRYKGNVYPMGDIMRLEKHNPFPDYWDGYCSESFFSGILVKVCDDTDWIIVGQYFS